MRQSKPREFVVAGRTISDESEPFIIAEIGHNHQGSIEKAKELFKAAKECGVDAVKLQKRDNKNLFTKKLFDQPYDNENSFGPTYGLHREALEFGKAEYVELKAYAESLGLVFFATAFDYNSVDFLESIDVPAYKVASGDLLNIPLIKYICATSKPIFVSTGGGFISDVMRVVRWLPSEARVCLMHCTASYPTEAEEMNLNVITRYRQTFPETVIGFSDHFNGIAMAPIAYVLGARVFEKHFTLSHVAKGTDHAFSLEPIGLKKMVRDLRRVKVALGDGYKVPYESEKKPLFKMGKKLVAAHDIPAGTILRRADIAIKSPNDGMAPYNLFDVLGKMVNKDLVADENIDAGCLECTTKQ